MEEIKMKVVSKQLNGGIETADVTMDDENNVTAVTSEVGPKIPGSDITSDGASAGEVLTADGQDGASWESVPSYKTFPDSWDVSNTIKDLCDDVNADPSAVEGCAFLGEVFLTDFPSTLLGNAELKVEVMSGTGTSGKHIHCVLTSGNIDPYRWEYTYWNDGVSVSGWISFYDKNNSLIPNENGTKDIGSSTNAFNRLYLTGRINFNYNGTDWFINCSSSGLSFGTGTSNVKFSLDITNGKFDVNLTPYTTNLNDLGSSSIAWKDLYLAGTLYGANYNLTINEIYTTLFNKTANSTGTQIQYSTCLSFSLTADTTFTFETAKTGCLVEYKAIITNNGASTITITLPSGTTIVSNDDNIAISSNTFTLASGVSVELNCINQNCIVFNFGSN